jgi:hypothetical protein
MSNPSSKSKSNPIFVHAHIIKCGGTTFFHILQKLFGRGFYRDQSLIFYQYSAEQFREIEKNCPWLRAYSSHKISLVLPFGSAEREIRAISFVRDPVDRFISHYFMHSHRKAGSLKSAPMAENMNLQQYAQYALAERNLESYIDGQVRFLMQRADDRALDKIKNLMQSDQALVFPLKRFDEACLILEKMFPEDFSDCAYVRKNISKKDEAISQQDREYIRKLVGELDYRLLQHSNEFLDRKLAELIGGSAAVEQALQEFRQRCQLLADEEARLDATAGRQPGIAAKLCALVGRMLSGTKAAGHKA